MLYLLVAFVIIAAVLLIIGVIKNKFKSMLSLVITISLALGGWYLNNPTLFTNLSTSSNKIVNTIKNKTTKNTSSSSTTDVNLYFVERLTGTETSSTNSNGNPLGSAKYGATFVVGDVDEYGRATYGHILVSDAQEPGQNGEKRESRISVNPAGWQTKFGTSWYNDRTHTIGYQFGGVNSDVRVLTTAGTYLNRGVTSRNGSNQNNTDSMLYYEQQLDSWLANHPNYKLDYYVKPIYEGSSGIVKQMYMQWVGVDSNNNTIAINIGGKSQQNGDYYYVLLDNTFPNMTIDYLTGTVTGE